MSINREFQDKINSRLDNAEKEKISEFEHKATEINKIETGREKNRQSLSDELEDMKWSNIQVTSISENLCMCQCGGKYRKMFE